MILNNEILKEDVQKVVDEKLSNSETVTISDIIDIYNECIVNNICSFNKIKLPYGNLYAKKRRVNTVMGNDIDFTFKTVLDINEDLKKNLINQELINIRSNIKLL